MMPHALARRFGSAPQAVLCSALLVLVGMPLAIVLWGTIRSDSPLAPGAGYSLEPLRHTYGELLSGGPFGHVVLTSLLLALAVVCICIPVGGAISLLLCRSNVPGRGIYRVLLLMPLFFSPLLDIIGWEFLFADRSGLVNKLWAQWSGMPGPLFSIFSHAGVVLVMALHVMPYVLLFLMGPIQSLNASTEEAAEVAGATQWQTLRFVTWPLLKPAVGACALFIFILGLELFTVPYILGNRLHLDTLAIWVYEYVHGFNPSLPTAAAGGSLLLLIAGITLFAYRRLTDASASRYVTVSGQGFRAREIRLGRWRWFLGALVGIAICCFTVIPFLAVVLRSLMTVRSTRVIVGDLNLRQYERLFSDSQLMDALANSLVLSVSGALLCVVLGGLIGLWNARQKSATVVVSDYLLMTAFALPGILLGIGFLWTFVSTPVYLTIWILLIAVVVRFSGLAVQGTTAGVLQTDKSLEEAAEVSGASRLFASLRITIPLLKGTLTSMWLMIFLIIFRELSMTVLLYGPETRTLTILTWNFTTDGDFGLAAALSVFQCFVSLCVVLAWRLLGGGNLGSLASGARQ